MINGLRYDILRSCGAKCGVLGHGKGKFVSCLVFGKDEDLVKYYRSFVDARDGLRCSRGK